MNESLGKEDSQQTRSLPRIPSQTISSGENSGVYRDQGGVVHVPSHGRPVLSDTENPTNEEWDAFLGLDE